MLRRLTLLSCAALCLALTACGPSFRHLQNRTVTEAGLLQDEVAAGNLGGSDVDAGDKNLALATSGDQSPANSVRYANLAAAHYRVVLSEQSLEESKKSLAAAEAALADSENEVKKYERILSEISARKEQ